jgi:hypothetical protein
MSLRGKLALLACSVLLGSAGWFYADGGVEYLMWVCRVPARPAAERQFVSRIERSMHRWSTSKDDGNREVSCRRETAQFIQLIDPVIDWGGTVATVYRVGTKAVLAVRIGRHTLLRTSYTEGLGATLIEPGSGLYPQVAALQAGDPVRFSGAPAARDVTCIYERNRFDDELSAALLFDFLAIRTD